MQQLGHDNLTQEDPISSWYVYLIRDRNNALYCGMTNDLERRFSQHVSGKGAKALRGKTPLSLVWHQNMGSKSEALKYEFAIKQWAKKKKEKLVESNSIIELDLN